MLRLNHADFKPTQDQIEAGESVLLAMANLNTITPLVKAYQTKVLHQLQLGVNSKWIERGENQRIILTESDTHLLGDADAELYWGVANIRTLYPTRKR